ncbi:hypothetical protein C4D60_Mb01t24030 [Musa balbisiana]|uniref:Uncharacterized protein n=1 Tax=Musa balbisiana TaxID=52838 RepID=A0A4V4H7K6_MUSBA|nr:hypothetical protein C4D60_Mb01t24030 [Musa balbisiana]
MMIVAEKEGIARAARGPVADCPAASSLPPLNSRPRRLHNFSFPTLSWRGQRFLRCSKLPSGASADLGDNRTSQMKSSPPRPLPGFRDSKEGERRGSEGREAEKDTSCAAAAAEATRPWNLRTRRAACNAPTERALAMEKINSPVKTMRLRSDESEKGETRKFSISLSRPEIEEDFFAIKGRKLPRRPKKRAKIVQRELDILEDSKKGGALVRKLQIVVYSWSLVIMTKEKHKIEAIKYQIYWPLENMPSQ